MKVRRTISRGFTYIVEGTAFGVLGILWLIFVIQLWLAMHSIQLIIKARTILQQGTIS